MSFDPLTPHPRKREGVDLSSYAFGKMPPQARDIEEAVLGAIMLEAHAIYPVLSLLTPECFYAPAHQTIFSAILSLFNQSKPVDILTVTNELKAQGKLEDVGGPFYVTELTSRIASAANIEEHARIIYELYIKRESIRVCSEVIKESYDDTSDAFDVVQKAEMQLLNLSSGNFMRVQHVSQPVRKNIEESDRLAQSPHALAGIPTGLQQLDEIMLGLEPGELTIAAARPGMGKTSLALSIAKNIARQHPVGFFSLEMSSQKITLRLQSMMSGVDSEQLRIGRMNHHERESFLLASERLAEYPLYFDDTSSIHIVDLRARASRMVMEYKIKVLMVDYLQLMRGIRDRSSNREQEISSISQGLKALSKDLNIHVLAMSQLSRAVESRGGAKKPMLSDLRESGAIEQDADNVWFIHRPEYYGIETDDMNRPTKGAAEIIVAKHRNGKTGSAFCRYDSHLTSFSNFKNEDNPF